MTVVFLAAAVLVSAVAAWCDWRRGQIPNWLTFTTMGIGPVAYLALGLAQGATKQDAVTEASYSVLGGLVCAVIPLALYSKSAIGGGDLKLFVGLGALLQVKIGIEAEMYGFCAAAIIA